MKSFCDVDKCKLLVIKHCFIVECMSEHLSTYAQFRKHCPTKVNYSAKKVLKVCGGLFLEQKKNYSLVMWQIF